MKKILFLMLAIVFVLSIHSFVYAQPMTGTWNSHSSNFDPGFWSETLWGGAEGEIGNEIEAESVNIYEFGDAFLENVNTIQTNPHFTKYRTEYLGGRLELFNDASAPWHNDTDMSLSFVVTGLQTIVTTWKFFDDDMAFVLKYTGTFDEYPCYIADVKARYNKALPDLTGSGTLLDDPWVISGELSWMRITVSAITVDIKPGSCPNPINVNSNGVIPVAISGIGFHPARIKPGTITLEDVPPLRWAWEDVTTPFRPCIDGQDAYECTDAGPDGIVDLTLKFDKQAVVSALGSVNDGDVLTLYLDCELIDGTQISGGDVVLIRKKGNE